MSSKPISCYEMITTVTKKSHETRHENGVIVAFQKHALALMGNS